MEWKMEHSADSSETQKNKNLKWPSAVRWIAGVMVLFFLLSTTALSPIHHDEQTISRAKTPTPEPLPTATLQYTPTATLTIEESLDRDFPLGNGQPVGMLIGSALLVLIVILGALLVGPLPNQGKKP
jgi:hypothetical protein